MAYWTLLISAFCCVGISALTGKGYYCRDPDTGKLYSVNSTWPSTTFCGNYSCKLRKKDTVKSVIPIREMMIDSLPQATPTQMRSKEENSIQTEKVPNKNRSTLLTSLYSTLVTQSPIENNNIENNNNKINENNLIKINSNIIENKPVPSEQGDRYLTENEINMISHLLHNVKKSDLEAIVDVYNLAQDIYKEMDKITNENIIEETIRAAKTPQRDIGGGKRYWYEPLNRLNKAGIGTDMELQGTHLYATAVERSTVDPNSYFQGPLTKDDFGVLPYYYSMSNFQRDHSYTHANHNPQPYPPTYEKPPCAQSTHYPRYSIPEPPKAYRPAVPSYYPYQPYGSVIKKAFPVDTQKVVQPYGLLPYPFSYIQHYNMSTYPYNVYYNSASWPHFDKNNYNYEQYFKAHLPQTQKTAENAENENKSHYQSSKEITLNQNVEAITYKDLPTNKNNEVKTHQTLKDNVENNDYGELKKNLLETILEQTKVERKVKPDWQTDPLATSVLEEIKAHFEDKARLIKPFSLRKKAKLERVGKVLKLDDLNREKRSVVDDSSNLEGIADEGMEVYVEKTTCPFEVDPGFYKMGNLTQPYPACCPRRIENSER